jgi:putative transposase
MQLVERHVISRSDPRYEVIDQAAFASKNLYNAALYEMRQAFIFGGKRLHYEDVYHRMKSHPAYKALPAKVAQQVLKLLDKNWTAWEEALKEWHADPSQFLGRPALPKYKDKQQGRNILVYTIQAISKKALKRGLICPSMLAIVIETKQQKVDQVRIVPRKGYYVVEVIYEQAQTQAEVNPALIASIDIGVNNLAALTSNKVGFVPRLVNGRPLKSTNQYYNKRKADLQSQLADPTQFTTRMQRMMNKRTRRIDHYLHTASKRIIALLVSEGIGTLIIGKNPNWKQESEMRKKDNQHFVQIPHARFVDMLCYKAKLVGIGVILQEESYTSRASFLDRDPLPVYGKEDGEPAFSGKRVKRGLYRAGSGKQFNSDVNGSYNILRKASPNAFSNGVEDVVVHPVREIVQTSKSSMV